MPARLIRWSIANRVSVLLLALMLSVAPLVGAQGGEFVATFDLPTEPAAEGDLAGVDPSGQTVVYWHQHSGAREEALNELIVEFNDNNPWGITVEASNQGGYGDIYTKMIAGIASGELPNLVVAYQNQSATYQLDAALASEAVDLEVLVLDDGSTDRTAEIAREAVGQRVVDRGDAHLAILAEDAYDGFDDRARVFVVLQRQVDHVLRFSHVPVPDWLAQARLSFDFLSDRAPSSPRISSRVASPASPNSARARGRSASVTRRAISPVSDPASS